MTNKDRLNAALESALARYEATMGNAFPCIPELDVVPDNAFWALAVPYKETVLIKASTGVVDATSTLWHEAMALSAKRPIENQLNVQNTEQAIDLSLMWLMLHELHHFEMGHFKINGGACLVENDKGHEFGQAFALTSRVAPKPSLIDSLAPSDKAKAPLCLELQADHDATEMVLKLYKRKNWPELRVRAACIFAMMVLIEQEEAKEPRHGLTHPKAATRIFMMLGHLAEMWTITARQKARKRGEDAVRAEDLPLKEEIEAYHAQVVAPAFGDALLLASAAGATSIVDNLGDVEQIISDIERAQTADHKNADAFLTAGAREWAELWPVNVKLLKLLGLQGLETEITVQNG